ncbi:hypothetical protein C8A00DRAFT_15004 [Chaetomidium leptoderma]|uniref:DUF7580 domain-containing protein n=1 Tax=Chaetomidium leptoderma TaxID=669021 RepID=A0AAN6VN37_9PEZI|nr:hypothetical protein C8A00DRAFT_15004 [Chaetomidium leptoderma]
MDPVSLALGIAPLCLGALKGAKHAKSKIKLLKHHAREVSRFRKRLKTQMSIFRDESQLLLQDAGVERDLAAELLEDYSHDYWAGADLEDQIRSFLGKKYIEVKQTTEHIQAQVTQFDIDLSALEEPDDSSSRGKVSSSRASRAVGVASKNSKLEEGIETLTDHVNEFRRLRKTARDLQKPRPVLAKQRKAMPRTYGLVARHSASFLECLSRTWSCLNSNGVHSRHTAKLFLDTDASDSCVNFRMILEYEAISGTLGQHLLFLHIRSEELSWVDVGLASPGVSSAPFSIETPEPRAKVRRVRFADSPSQSSVRSCRVAEAESRTRRQNLLAHNLCQAKDVCQHVFDSGKAFHQSRQEGCVGYLLSADNLTHQLMAAQDRESTAIQTRPYSPTSLASIIQPSTELKISVNEQLRLALRLARSVLQYHSTPWWRRNWDLSDFSYFGIDAELSVSLATLHIDAKLVSKADNMTMERVVAHIPTPPSDDDAQMLCGIRNVTLHSLGAALLQIGRWEALDTEDVVLVRRAAAKPSRMGPRYDELTAKCLYCDFGFGADLNKPQLQGAIYENVIYELEQMVSLLEG